MHGTMMTLRVLALPLAVCCAFVPDPYLPDLLIFRNGTRITTRSAWRERRIELQNDLSQHVLGTLPPAVPPLVRATELNRTTAGYAGASSSFVRITFDVSAGGTAQEISFDIELLLPFLLPDLATKPNSDSRNANAQAAVDYPVLMTQWNHRQWAVAAVGRGFIGVVTPTADARDVAPLFQRAYPNCSMALIAARAFVSSRVLDFVLGENTAAVRGSIRVPADHTRVGITGHSRNGKQSLIAAAFDERFTAVVGSSPGVPIASPWRFASSNFYGETPRTGGVAGFWWLNSTLQYDGYPERMPIDAHAIGALIAPRVCAIASGHNDEASDQIFGNELHVRAAQRVYDLLAVASDGSRDNEKNSGSRLRLMLRPGDHHGFDDVQTYFDFFQWGWGRVTGADTRKGANAAQGLLSSQPPACRGCWWVDPADPSSFSTPAGFSWDAWHASRSASQRAADATVPSQSTPLAARVRWMLSLRVPDAAHNTGSSVGTGSLGVPRGFSGAGDLYCEEGEGAYIAQMLHHDVSTSGALKRTTVSFGEYLSANVYWPSSMDLSGGPVPAVIWLHPYSYNTGYNAIYQQSRVHEDVARAGFVVFAFEMAGFGLRNFQGGARFYERYGGSASLLGTHIEDVRAAVDFLFCRSVAGRADPRCATGAYPGTMEADVDGKFPVVDIERLVVSGYSLGGLVALHATALDARIKAVAAFAAFTPMRTDVSGRSTGGGRRLFELHALVPRLGYFEGHEASTPYDYDELLSALAPRPTLIYAPQHDRDATHADIVECVNNAEAAWAARNASTNFSFVAPDDITRMEAPQVQVLLQWLNKSVTAGS